MRLRTYDIKQVQIIDDDPEMRNAHQYALEDLFLESVPINIIKDADLQTFMSRVIGNSQAAIFDHQLKIRQYAPFNGAEAVASLYLEKFPAILCTRYESHLDEIRIHRANIPVVLPAEDLNPDSLLSSFEQCIAEFDGEYTSSRKAWRALIRIDGWDEHYVHLIIPSWEPKSVVRLLASSIPKSIVNYVRSGIERLHAWVNIGAENEEELYFKDWETR